MNARNHGSATAGIRDEVLQVEHNRARPITVIVREKVGCLWFQVGQNFLDGRTQGPRFRCCISGLHRNHMRRCQLVPRLLRPECHTVPVPISRPKKTNRNKIQEISGHRQ